MGDEAGGVKIVKVNQTAPLLKRVRERLGTTAKAAKAAKAPMTVVKHTSKHRTSQPKHGILKHGKTARKAPRFEAVRDPAKSPPVKKQSRLRILTEHGAATRRAKIAKDVKAQPIHDVRKTLKKHNLNVSEKTPPDLARQILIDAKGAGLISSG
jgi:hypothetical protein